MSSMRPNLDLSGMATASGGTYQDIKVEGISKVHGDIDCVRCDIEGVSEVFGSVKAESLNIRGKAKVRGDVFADQVEVEGATTIAGKCQAKQKLRIRGKATIGGDVTGDMVIVDGSNTVDGDCRGHDIKVRGRTRISGGIFADEIFLEGSIKVGGSCETEIFRCDGMFSINGLLNAGRVLIRLERTSRVQEIGGEEIRVERGRGTGFLQRKRRLVVETIEGDEIYLEHTTAKVVRGNKVMLGPATEVDCVEYHTEFQQAEDAKVGESKKV